MCQIIIKEKSSNFKAWAQFGPPGLDKVLKKFSSSIYPKNTLCGKFGLSEMTGSGWEKKRTDSRDCILQWL